MSIPKRKEKQKKFRKRQATHNLSTFAFWDFFLPSRAFDEWKTVICTVRKAKFSSPARWKRLRRWKRLHFQRRNMWFRRKTFSCDVKMESALEVCGKIRNKNSRTPPQSLSRELSNGEFFKPWRHRWERQILRFSRNGKRKKTRDESLSDVTTDAHTTWIDVRDIVVMFSPRSPYYSSQHLTSIWKLRREESWRRISWRRTKVFCALISTSSFVDDFKRWQLGNNGATTERRNRYEKFIGRNERNLLLCYEY